MNRLTDKTKAEALRRKVEEDKSRGAEPDIRALRYIKLAGYEDAEERWEERLGGLLDKIRRPE